MGGRIDPEVVNVILGAGDDVLADDDEDRLARADIGDRVVRRVTGGAGFGNAKLAARGEVQLADLPAAGSGRRGPLGFTS